MWLFLTLIFALPLYILDLLMNENVDKSNVYEHIDARRIIQEGTNKNESFNHVNNTPCIIFSNAYLSIYSN